MYAQLTFTVMSKLKHRSRDVYRAINVRSEAEDVYGHNLRSEAQLSDLLSGKRCSEPISEHDN